METQGPSTGLGMTEDKGATVPGESLVGCDPGDADGFYQFWQAAEDGGAAEPEFVVDSGVAADDGASGDVAGDAGLGGGNDTIPDFAVSGNANLPGEDNVLANFGRSGEAGLGA